MKKRNYTIDMLKGFAIMLVVYVHLYYAGIGELPFGMRYIRSFHMPLFSFASGFLTFGRTNLPFRKYFFKKARALFVPYTVFFLIFIAVSQIFSLLQNQCFIKFNIDWLWAYLVAGKKLELIDGQTGGFSIIVLWFFTTTFFAYVAFWFLTRLNKYMFIVATVLLALLSLWFQKIFLNIEFTTPYNVKIIPIFTFYMCIGAIFKQYFIGKVSKPTKAVVSVVMVAAAAAVVIAKGGVGSIRTFEPLYIPPLHPLRVRILRSVLPAGAEQSLRVLGTALPLHLRSPRHLPQHNTQSPTLQRNIPPPGQLRCPFAYRVLLHRSLLPLLRGL